MGRKRENFVFSSAGGGENEVVDHRKIKKEVGDLIGSCNSLMGPSMTGKPRNILSVEENLATRGQEISCNQVKEGRLAGPVGADHHPSLPGSESPGIRPLRREDPSKFLLRPSILKQDSWVAGRGVWLL